MKFIVGEVIWVINNPEIDVHREAVSVIEKDIKNRTYTVQKTKDPVETGKSWIIKEEDAISPIQWLKKYNPERNKK